MCCWDPSHPFSNKAVSFYERGNGETPSLCWLSGRKKDVQHRLKLPTIEGRDAFFCCLTPPLPRCVILKVNYYVWLFLRPTHCTASVSSSWTELSSAHAAVSSAHLGVICEQCGLWWIRNTNLDLIIQIGGDYTSGKTGESPRLASAHRPFTPCTKIITTISYDPLPQSLTGHQ